jgi:hypothetical protein
VLDVLLAGPDQLDRLRHGFGDRYRLNDEVDLEFATKAAAK